MARGGGWRGEGGGVGGLAGGGGGGGARGRGGGAGVGTGRLMGVGRGGTWTDVSHDAGRCELAEESVVAGVRVRAPMMQLHTVAAGGGVIDEDGPDGRDYDVGHYERVLRETYAARLERAFGPGDYAAVFASPDQMLLIAPAMCEIRTVLTDTVAMPQAGRWATEARIPRRWWGTARANSAAAAKAGPGVPSSRPAAARKLK